MFGKYETLVNTQLDNNLIVNALEKWSMDNNLSEVYCSDGYKKYRFGSPFLSNPIYIEINFDEKPIKIVGWVQTLIPFFRWKLIKTEKRSFGSKIDYRRKGGYFCYQLKQSITSD